MGTLKKELSVDQKQTLLATLQDRFATHMSRHECIIRNNVQAKLEDFPQKLSILHAMEQSGGEPDLIGFDKNTGTYMFCDCASESPKGRRSLCYDRNARKSRKQNKPEGNAVDTAAEMGIELLTEEQYRYLQTIGRFDTKTSSRIQTPESIRKLGGALFCDRRYETVFTYHNGAESYYAARGFRGIARV